MKKIDFSYEITIWVEISEEEFDLLCESFYHTELVKYINHGGWMYGKKGRLDFLKSQGGDLELDLTDKQIDICCKAIELASFDNNKFDELYTKMFNLHKEIIKEHERIIKSR